MRNLGFPVPILPGKEDLERDVANQLAQRKDEYEASRRNAGITMERIYLQGNPDGSSLSVVYVEGSKGFAEVVEAFATSGTEFDRWFFQVNEEISGIDFTQPPPPPGGEPERLATWHSPDGRRGPGLAVCSPIQEGKGAALGAFLREAFETRRDELERSRAAFGSTAEAVFLNHTPMGDFAVVYVEGDDPVEANRRFAASDNPYDRWFKDQLRDLFPPFVDWDQPAPVNEQLWDWTAGQG